MRWVERAQSAARKMLVVGLGGCLAVLSLPVGCASSIREAPIRYRQQNKNAKYFLPDITVERFQECIETYGEELGQIEPAFAHANGHVQVTSEGQILDVQVTGIPDRARELAACTRITLREMTVPYSVLSLRQEQEADAADEQTVQRGNELGNPIVLVELGAALAEYVAAHGGRIVLYTVTIEVLSAAAVAATTAYLKKKKKKTCLEHLKDCLNTATNDLPGNHFGQGRCGACFQKCKDGDWPPSIDLPDGGSCAY